MNAVHFENEASSVRLKTLLFTKTLGGYFMQAIVETVFDACYLIGVVTLGILMIAKSHGNKQYRLFGIMAVVLGFGDAFHLVPRAVALCTTGLDNFAVALGTGKFITSITMTVFYIILYYIWRIRYHVKGKNIYTIFVYGMAIARIVLCLFPQNAWTSSAFHYRGEFIEIFLSQLWVLLLFIYFIKVLESKMINYSKICG